MGKRPYANLYVYEIDGRALGSRRFFEQDFVGCWNEGDGSFLFFSAPHDEEVRRFVEKEKLNLLSTNMMDYGAWQAGDELKPFRIGNLLFSPPWEDTNPGPGETLVYLDPCVVFGNGSHPTTRSCLEALREIYEREVPRKVLDLGTGSGVLALAAAKWGSERIIAVDCNELAVDTALRNVTLNGESGRIEVRAGKAEDLIDEDADLICANLHLQVMEALLQKDAFYRKRWFVLSGLFVRDALEIEKQMNRRSIQTVLKIEEKVWCTWVGLNAEFC